VAVRGVFAGESMFHHRPNASKLAVLALAEHLRAQGSAWFDIQQLTPHMAALGAEEVSREEFLALLAAEQDSQRKLF
jgi:leucyl/phenylalanyl-tRNA--protein transferase